MHLLCVHTGAGMLSRGKLEYTGFAQPAGWAVPSLGALPVAQELLVVPDLHADHRYCTAHPHTCSAAKFQLLALSLISASQ